MTLDGFYELLPSPPHALPGWASWTGFTPWVRTPIKAPTYILGDCPGALLSYYHAHIGEADTGLFILHDVGVVNKGFLIRDDMAVANNYIGHSRPWCIEQMQSGHIKPTADYRRSRVDQAVLLLGTGYDIYGHWIVDILPKLYVLHRTGYDIEQLNYLVPRDILPFGNEWIEAVGLRSEQLIFYDDQDELVEVAELLVPSFLRSGSRASRLFKPAVEFMMQRVTSSEPWRRMPSVAGAEAIFVSRAKANRGSRSLVNREAIEAIAVEAGYVMLYPEQLPIVEQVAWFAAAGRIAGEYGSGLHSSVFAGPGAKVCCLRSSARHPGFLQSGLADAMEQDCGYVLGPAPLDAININFEVGEADFRQALELMSLPSA